MNSSSGIKRGLSVAAVSALAVAGLPFLAGTAHAEPISASYGPNSVDLATGEVAGGKWDASPDGQDTLVHLVAATGVNSQEVKFEFSQDGGTTWTDIDRVAVSHGIAQVFWNTTGLPTGSTQVRATGYDSNNVVTGTETNTQDLNPSGTSVDISNSTASEIGLFTAPYNGNHTDGAISGTTSAGSAFTSAPDFGGTGVAIMGAPDGNGIRPFTGRVRADGYNFATDPDELLVRAVGGLILGSDDAESVTPYSASISGASIAADPTNIPTPPGGNSDITITVTDQKGKPIVGAQVVSPSADDQATGVPNGTASNHVVGYTDALGQVTVSHPANTGANSYYYWVNTTSTTSYEDGTDYLLHVKVGSYTPAPTTLTASSADGDAFDLDEWTNSDVKVKVVDQNGAPMNGQTVRYTWKFTPFNPSPTNTAWSTSEATSNTNAQGLASIDRPTWPGGNAGTEGTYELMAYVNTNGTPGYQSGEPTVTKDLKAGQATPVWNGGDRSQYLAGSTDTLEGKLVLDDGTPLAGRFVTVNYTPGAGEPGGTASKIAAQASQPAGTNRISDTEASAKTDASGVFKVAVTDPTDNPQGKELNANAQAVFAPGAVPPATQETDNLKVDFLRSLAPASIVQVGGDSFLISGEATPGRPVTDKYVVKNAQGDFLSDVDVTAALDHGFFTPGKNGAAFASSEANLVPVSTADGADYGVWKNDTASKHFTSSDTDGTFSLTRAIERDAGFDDDGMVDQVANLTAGSATLADTVTFDTLYAGGGAANEPLNPGGVQISLGDDQESTILPDVRIDQSVGYRTEAKDSFGNLIEDEVLFRDNTAAAGLDAPNLNWWAGGGHPIHSGAADYFGLSQFSGDTASSVGAYSWTPGTTQIVGSGNQAATNTWLDDPTTVAVDPSDHVGTKTQQSIAAPINWYTVDWTDPNTILDISSDEVGTVDVGTPVHTEVEAVDQKGQPVDDVEVKFVRKGPNYQQGDYNWDDDTNNSGIASYDWVGNSAGTAQVTGFVYDTWGPLSDDDLIQKLTDDEITFGNSPVDINLKLKGGQDGKKDVIKAMADDVAAGKQALLFRNGQQIKAHALDSSGDFTFKVKDKNGNKTTKYTVKVLPSDSTNAAKKSIKIK
ncbi:hypothetical protein [Nocardioides sp.]|uniref:hypothetical protein n=1 Tax=Nocardioides sp. TaxID=35761 RepID=UPI003782D47F